MKNNLTDLQNHLFEMIEKLNDDSLKGDDLTMEISRSMAINELCKTAVANGALMLKCANDLYGIPVSSDLPLIPPSPSDSPKLVNGKKTALIDIPRVR